MQIASLRRWLMLTVTTLSVLASIAVMSGGSAHATQVNNVTALPKGTIRPFVDPNATITGISISFLTHNDNKDFDTAVSVRVQEKFNVFLTQDLASLNNFAGTTEFKDNPPSTHAFSLNLVAQSVKLSDLVNAPIYRIVITPNGHDTWIFDATITVFTSDGSQFSSQTVGINLNQNNRTFNGVFS